MFVHRIDYLVQFDWKGLDAPQILPVLRTAWPLLTTQMYISDDWQMSNVFHSEREKHLIVASAMESECSTVLLLLT